MTGINDQLLILFLLNSTSGILRIMIDFMRIFRGFAAFS